MGPWDITDCCLSYINISLRWSCSVGGNCLPVSLTGKVKCEQTKKENSSNIKCMQVRINKTSWVIELTV